MDQGEIDYSVVQKSRKLKRMYIAQTWNKEEEQILQSWAEKASGWAWLHDKSHRYYRKQSDFLTYPSIILTTISSGLGFTGMKQFWYITYVVAFMNIIATVFMSFQKFLRSTENSELHSRFFSIFSSYTRKIALELTLNPEDRKDCIDFCKMCKDEYDKAVAESPPIPDKVIIMFKKEFHSEKNKPEVANGLFHFTNYPSSPKKRRDSSTDQFQITVQTS
jgi:hypothetical protein